MAKKEILTKIVVDCATGERQLLPLSAEEIAQRDQDLAAAQEAMVAQQAELERITTLKESAKAKLIAGQPLTEEEAGVLL